MSNSAARLHSILSKNTANTIKPKPPKIQTPKPSKIQTPKPPKIQTPKPYAIKPKIQTPKPTKQKPLITLAKHEMINKGVRDLLGETDSRKLVEKFKSLSRHEYFRKKYKIYNCTIHRLVLANEIGLIEDLIESQKNHIDGEAFAAHIIFLYGKAGLFEHARKMFDELPERGYKQGRNSFHALLGAALRNKKFDMVYELFRDLPLKLSIKPSLGCYNIAVNALCKLGLFDKAVALLDEIEENGVKLGVSTFNTLLGAFYGKGGFDEGEKIWERMIGSGVEPSVISYNLKLQRLVNDKKVSEAMILVMELESKGLSPDEGTYNALISCACKVDDLDGARRWYNELWKSGCDTTKATFNVIVPYLCDKRDYGLAFQVCKRMFKNQCSVDQTLLQRVVDGLAKNSMMDEAKILVGLGKHNSYFPYDLVLPSGFKRFFL